MVPAMGQTSASDWVDQSLALYNQGKYDEAIQACEKAIELDPKYAMPWNNKGAALMEKGRYDDAVKAYDKAIEIDPEYKWAWANKGLALADLRKYNESIEAYDKAIELDSKYVNAWYNKGLALKLLGRTTEADAAFAKAKALGYEGTDLPGNPQTADLTYKGYITFSNNRGESIDDAIVIHNAKTDWEGVDSEYYYLEDRFGKKGVDWDLDLQSLSDVGDRHYDVMDITLSNGRKLTIYFDITDFFGKV
jgi:tetratricopeptide (TPR) repeat protein